MALNRWLVIPALVLAASFALADTGTVAWVMVAMAAMLFAQQAAVVVSEPDNKQSDSTSVPPDEEIRGSGLVIPFERLRQIEESERLAAIGQLSAGIAHEINNPVAYISSNLRELEDDLARLRDFIHAVDRAADQLGEDHPVSHQMLEAYQRGDIRNVLECLPERLEDCVQGTERLGRIVRDMKRLVSGGRAPKADIAINEQLQAIINIAGMRIKGGMQLQTSLLDPGPVLYCNGSQIGQVVLNLLVNAIQAVDPESGIVRLQQEVRDKCLYLIIEDNGPGVSVDIQEKIFQPFFTTKTESDGTGVGLSLSLQLVREHNGRIELDSEPGKGSRFSIILPMTREQDHV